MLRRTNWKSLLLIAVIVGVAYAALAVQKIDLQLGDTRFERGSNEILGLQLGLDLAGGIHLVYQAGTEDVTPSNSQMNALISNIRRRVAGLGATEPNIQRLGDDRLLIQLPGLGDDPNDLDRAKRLIGQTASLAIVERVCLNAECTLLEDRDTGLTGEDLASASAANDSVTGQPIVLFQLRRSSASAFAELTARIFETNNTSSPDQLAFLLDDTLLVAASVRSSILSGSGQISVSTIERARDLAVQIDSGRLPVDITILTEQVVDASLGDDSLKNSLVAAIVGLALVLFFMIAYYRGAGLVAAVSMLFYTAIVLAVFKLIPVTLTLAGVAGFILSMGMAVDANILIFERMKEELRVGRTVNVALQVGFQRAWTSIRDGNVSTLIIAVILYWFGTQFAASTITGFALALIIGVLTSMFTAIFITRNMLTFIVSTPLNRFPRLFTPESLPKRRKDAGRPARQTSETDQP